MDFGWSNKHILRETILPPPEQEDFDNVSDWKTFPRTWSFDIVKGVQRLVANSSFIMSKIDFFIA